MKIYVPFCAPHECNSLYIYPKEKRSDEMLVRKVKHTFYIR
jgi:hypothetical protein